MFTGLVESLAPLERIADEPPGKRLVVREPAFAHDAEVGESIAINGCCLMNLERSLRAGERMGGHFVTGHIDGVGCLTRREDEGDWARLVFQAPTKLMRQVVSKGSIAVDGVSLTVNEVGPTGFGVALIPHTLAVTTLGRREVGDRVNLETDLLAKYVQKQLAGDDQ